MISLHRSSSTKPLKDDESSPTNMNLVIDAQAMSPRPDKSSIYEQGTTSDEQTVNAIFDANAYNHTYESLVEFYSDIYYIMNSKEISDGRNVGTVTGVAAVGVVGCLTFGIGYIAGIAAIVVGSTIGRCCGNTMSKKKKKKKKKITQEDLYISKLDCMICFVEKEKKKLKNDLNRLRLVMEKIIEEFTPTLELSLFKKQKEINLLLKKLRRVLMQKHVDEAMLLSYKLFVAAEERFDMKDRKHLQDASRRFNQVFIPFVKIMELDTKNWIKSNPNVRAYIKIKALTSNSNKIEIYSQLIASRPTVETLEKLKQFLQEEVDIKANFERAMSSVGETNPQMTEGAALRNPNSPYKFDPVNQVIKLTTIHEQEVRSAEAEAEENNADYLHNNNQHEQDSIHSPNKKDFDEQDSEKKDHIIPQNPVPRTRPKPHLIIPRASEDSIKSFSESHSIQNGNPDGGWTISMKLHDCDLNFGEAVQREVDAQKEALMRLSTRTMQRSPTKKGSKKEDEEEKYEEEDQQRASVSTHRSAKREKSHLFGALTPRRFGKTLSSVFQRQKTRQESQASNDDLEKKQEDGANIDVLNQNQNFSKAEEMFQKILAIGADYTSKWDRVSTSPVITIDKIRPEGSPVVLIRAWAVVPGFTPKEVFDQIYDTEKRAKWETVTMDLKVVEKIDEFSQVIYFYVKTPIGISERDFVQMRNFKLDYPEKDTIVMSFKSVNHPKMPNVKGRIRAETHIAGYIMRPSKTQPNSTDFCIVSQSDIKGNIPKVIVNMASGKAPSEWINRLIKACEKSRKEKK